MRPEPLGPIRAELGECPVWAPQEQRLHWLDILGQRRLITDPQTGATEVTALPRPTSCIARTASGGWVAAGEHGLWQGETQLARLPPGSNGNFNDGKCDAAGRLWIGTANADGRFDCALWRLDPGAAPRLMVSDISMSNGIGWSPDGRVMYYADSAAHAVHAFDFEPESGAISNQRRFFETCDQEVPDGLSVDAEGHVWLAVWGGSALLRIDPAGDVVARIALPTPRVSSCAFGGADLKMLYITTACEGASATERAADPLMGALFVLDPGVAGLPVAAYSG